MRYSAPIDDLPTRHRLPRGLRVASTLGVVCWLSLGLALALRAAAVAPSAAAAPLPGEPVPHLACAQGYTATIYAAYLQSPDGLAFDPNGVLHVVEEGARTVRRINGDWSTTRVLRGLRSPEGIAFDEAGNLYVVEDTRRGRLLRLSPDGQVTTLAENLSAPEGVTVGPTAEGDGTSAPTVYVTESNVQFVRNPYDLQSGITALSPDGGRTQVITHTPTLHASGVAFWSYAGLTAGADGRLYVTNELSGQKLTRPVVVIPGVLTYTAQLLTGESVFAVDPARGTRTLIASDLLVPEGLSFSADGDFPLYVAEENAGDSGRLSRIERDGRRTTVCEGFRGIEVSEGAGGGERTPSPAPRPTPAPAPAPDADPSIGGRFRTLWRVALALARRIVGYVQSG